MRVAGLGLSLLALLAGPASAAEPPTPESYVRLGSQADQARARSELGPRFRVLESAHFRVFSDTSLRYHTVVTGVLEQFYALVQPRFFERDMAPVDFFLIDDGIDYEQFMRARGYPDAPGFGLYDSRSRSLFARRYFPDGRESGVGTLFHEAVHAMIDADFASPPPRWVNEGFASLFEVGRVLRGQWVYGNPNPWRETPFRSAFERGEVPSLEALVRLPDAAFEVDRERLNILYNAGRSLFLHLLRDRGEAVLADFLGRLRGGEDAASALSAATGRSLDEVERGWHASLRSRNFAGDVLQRARGADALRILEQGAREYPGYGNLEFALAAEYLRDGDPSRAAHHAERALADPHLIYRQRAHIVYAEARLSSDPNAAAHSLRTAIAFQPWNEVVLGRDFELLAAMYERAGRPEVSDPLREELQRLRETDAMR